MKRENRDQTRNRTELKRNPMCSEPQSVFEFPAAVAKQRKQSRLAITLIAIFAIFNANLSLAGGTVVGGGDQCFVKLHGPDGEYLRDEKGAIQQQSCDSYARDSRNRAASNPNYESGNRLAQRILLKYGKEYLVTPSEAILEEVRLTSRQNAIVLLDDFSDINSDETPLTNAERCYLNDGIFVWGLRSCHAKKSALEIAESVIHEGVQSWLMREAKAGNLPQFTDDKDRQSAAISITNHILEATESVETGHKPLLADAIKLFTARLDIDKGGGQSFIRGPDLEIFREKSRIYNNARAVLEVAKANACRYPSEERPFATILQYQTALNFFMESRMNALQAESRVIRQSSDRRIDPYSSAFKDALGLDNLRDAVTQLSESAQANFSAYHDTFTVTTDLFSYADAIFFLDKICAQPGTSNPGALSPRVITEIMATKIPPLSEGRQRELMHQKEVFDYENLPWLERQFTTSPKASEAK